MVGEFAGRCRGLRPRRPAGGARAAAFWDNAAVGQASAAGSRPLPTDGVHGCFVGNGLDRSGDVCRCCMVKYCCGVAATIGRPPTYRSNAFSEIVSCKANGRLWETRGPGMPGPYRAAAKKRTPTQPSRRGSAAENLPFQGRCSVSKDLPLRGRCPEGAEGENLAIARNISGSRTVLSPTACGRSPLAEGAKG